MAEPSPTSSGGGGLCCFGKYQINQSVQYTGIVQYGV